MRNPFIKVHMLTEGRNLRLPLTILFYNAILAFVMLIFLVFNAESSQEGLYYDTSVYLHQFLILSSIQIVTVFLLMPFYVSGLYVTDREKHMLEQFAMIPGINRQFVEAKIFLVLMMNGILFISGVPVIGLACIYTGLGWSKIIRLGLTVLLLAFWSGALSVFFYSISNRLIWSFAGTISAQFAFLIGTLLLIELSRNSALLLTKGGSIPVEVSVFCLILLSFNPISTYLGYYGNITGDNGVISFYCSHFGIDASGRWFSLLFYKISGLVCIITGLVFLGLAVKYMNKNSSKIASHS
ncbi:MAG: hypothetical protein IJI25_10035 [Eubacterium sp.]|nr:hypothetical protein [Eubacterium sp.]